jgi:hypothetical protein
MKTPRIQNEERILKTEREKHKVIHKGNPSRIIVDSSIETQTLEGIE